MWLQCSYTNHSPGVIAGYFMDCVAEYNRFPSHVRTDCGTENVLVAAIQSYVSGSESAHVYGTSPGNQRIEAGGHSFAVIGPSGGSSWLNAWLLTVPLRLVIFVKQTVYDTVSSHLFKPIWMLCATNGIHTEFDQAKEHVVQLEFQMNFFSCHTLQQLTVLVRLTCICHVVF